jgi:5-methylcytosine-specific restriction endonuclease McrA
MSVCPYCRVGLTRRQKGARLEKTDATKDHIHPVSRGGSKKAENRIICCYRCNGLKSNHTLEEWLVILVKKNDHKRIEHVREIVLACWGI